MLFVYIKRVVILGFLVSSLILLNVFSEENLLENLPSEQAILQSIIDKKEQEEKILKDLEDQRLKELKEEQERIKDEIKEALKVDKIDRAVEYAEVFDNSIKHTFLFEFTQEAFDAMVASMIEYDQIFGADVWPGDYRSNEYQSITVTYIDHDTVISIEEVGIRTKGNIYSRRLPIDELGNHQEVHYMLKFNETFDYEEGTDEYTALKKREVFDIEQLLFKWNNTGDPGFSNEVYSLDLFQKVGVVVPNASFAEVLIVIDGEVKLRSLYNIFEHFDEEFIRKHFQDEPTKEVGDLYKMSWSADLTPINEAGVLGVRNWETGFRPLYGKETNTKNNDYGSIIDFTYQLAEQDIVKRKQWLDTRFDVDSYIKSLAVNVLLGNPDDYRGNLNNYYMYFDETGYATYIPFDYDNSLGVGWPGADNFSDYTLGNDIYNWGRISYGYFDQRPLVDNVLYYEEYQILYENYLEEYIDSGLFSYEAYHDIVELVDTLYGDTFAIYNNREYYFNTKIERTLEQIEYYRNQR